MLVVLRTHPALASPASPPRLRRQGKHHTLEDPSMHRSPLRSMLAVATLAMAFGATSARAGLTSYGDFASASAAVATATTSVTIPDTAPACYSCLGSGDSPATYTSATFATSPTLIDANFCTTCTGLNGSP